MSRQVQLFVTKFAKFLVCLFLLDAGLGEIHRYFFFRQASGKFYRINYTMDVTTDDLLVFGSSHAAAHYVPAVFEKELGVTCYNAGVAGQQILIHETLQEVVLHRTTPKLMILDIDTYGFYDDLDQYDRLSDLHPFYYKHPAIIGKVLALEPGMTRVFLKSKLYQYNSTIVHVLRYWLAPQNDDKGYRATFVQLTKPAREGEMPPVSPRARRIDANMVAAFEQFVLNSINSRVRLVLAISPNLEYESRGDDAVMEKIYAIAHKYGISLFNHTNDRAFIGRYELFADAGHLNDAGARIFSKMIADEIKRKFPNLAGR
jgi:hypothetical protein